VGGLFFSQFITLYITPVVYIYLDRLQERLNRKFSFLRSRGKIPGREKEKG
jgi:HAE1 family hydrophobic/amphiphilic exporter-1